MAMVPIVPYEHPFEHLLFASGWLLAPAAHAGRLGWNKTAVGSFNLWSAPETPVASYSSGATLVMIIGRPMDPFGYTSDAGAIVTRMAGEFEKGRFLDFLDRLTGRWIAVVDEGHGPVIYQDAAGTRAVFYADGLAASHSALIAADPVGPSSLVSAIWKNLGQTSPGVKYLPGILAPHLGVRALTPNCRLRMSDMSVKRFWPREPRQEVGSVSEVAMDVSRILTRSLRLAADTWSLGMSLTAGLDTRVTLAASREIAKRVFYFSYIQPDKPNKVHHRDLKVATSIAQSSGLEHRIVEFGATQAGDDFNEFREVWVQNLGIPRGIPSLAKAYVDRWPVETMHVRSNVAEVGRVFYKGPRLDSITPAALIRWWNPDMEGDADSIGAFEEFCEASSFNDESMLGYDPLDIFYWEHRIGAWHAWLCLEMDVSHDTLPIFSNRVMLKRLLSLPFEARESAAAYHEVIELLWPELHAWPINGRQWHPG